MRAAFVGFVLVSCLAGCARSRVPRPAAPRVQVRPPPAPRPSVPAARKAKIEASRDREAFVRLRSNAATKKSVPSAQRFEEAPLLVRAAAAMPDTLEAEMKAWQTLQREGTLDKRLLNEVFFVVSAANDCGY